MGYCCKAVVVAFASNLNDAVVGAVVEMLEAEVVSLFDVVALFDLVAVVALHYKASEMARVRSFHEEAQRYQSFVFVAVDDSLVVGEVIVVADDAEVEVVHNQCDAAVQTSCAECRLDCALMMGVVVSTDYDLYANLLDAVDGVEVPEVGQWAYGQVVYPCDGEEAEPQASAVVASDNDDAVDGDCSGASAVHEGVGADTCVADGDGEDASSVAVVEEVVVDDDEHDAWQVEGHGGDAAYVVYVVGVDDSADLVT